MDLNIRHQCQKSGQVFVVATSISSLIMQSDLLLVVVGTMIILKGTRQKTCWRGSEETEPSLLGRKSLTTQQLSKSKQKTIQSHRMMNLHLPYHLGELWGLSVFTPSTINGTVEFEAFHCIQWLLYSHSDQLSVSKISLQWTIWLAT